MTGPLALGLGANDPLLLTPSRWRQRLSRVLIVVDLVALGIATVAAYSIRSALGDTAGWEPLMTEGWIVAMSVPIWVIALHTAGAYRPRHFTSGAGAVWRFVLGVLGGAVALGFLSFATSLQLSRAYVGLLVVLAILLGVLTRTLIRMAVGRSWRQGRHVQQVLIVGVNAESVAIADAIVAHPEAGHRLIGFVDDSLPVGTKVVGDTRVVDRLETDIARRATDLGVGLIILSGTSMSDGTLRGLTTALEGSAVDIAIAPSLFDVATRRLEVDTVANVPVLQVQQVRLQGGRALVKRVVDLVGVVTLLAVGLPLMAATALAVRFDSRGPALFRQTRIGKDGEPFTILKFRTMYVDANSRLDELGHLNEAGHHFFKIREDPRVTRVGRFLRKWSIDEIPQLWNVLRGDMSLIGPRPPLPEEVARYEPWHHRRLRVRPGVSGMWQVSGRSDVPFEEAVRLDLFYIENWSLGLDLTILAKTVKAVLGRDGAY